MSDKVSYDLTTSEGIKNATTATAKNAAILALTGPIGFLAKLAYDVGSKVFESTEDVVSAQTKAATDIIRAGAENGVSEVSITLSQEAGASFGSSFDGHPIKAKLGKSGSVRMTVKYKDAR